jgi:phosphoribosylanthranilate isomerase
MKLKVCGMKYQENITEVALLRPDYLGFIFYEDSPRNFTGSIPKISKEIKKIGVFVNAPVINVIEKIKTYDLDIVQLHGQESPEFCSELKNNVPYIEIIKVFSIKEKFNFGILKPFESNCDYYLFDTKGELPGGNGYVFDWKVLSNYSSSKPFFLSGGIGLDQIESVKSFFKSDSSKHCFSIDVNSRFEIEPGRKDVNKLSEFKSQL